MKTKIFDSYGHFLGRKDKSINGVSRVFVEENKNWEEDNKENTGCYNCTDCTYCTYCSNCSDCSNCSNCSDCSNCSYCSYCTYCSDCSDCSDCSNCSDCTYCSDCTGIESDDSIICITNIYTYVCCPRLKSNGEQWIQMGCFLRKREDWERDFWNNNREFPNDNSQKSNDRKKAFDFACLWLDYKKSTTIKKKRR